MSLDRLRALVDELIHDIGPARTRVFLAYIHGRQMASANECAMVLLEDERLVLPQWDGWLAATVDAAHEDPDTYTIDDENPAWDDHVAAARELQTAGTEALSRTSEAVAAGRIPEASDLMTLNPYAARLARLFEHMDATAVELGIDSVAVSSIEDLTAAVSLVHAARDRHHIEQRERIALLRLAAAATTDDDAVIQRTRLVAARLADAHDLDPDERNLRAGLVAVVELIDAVASGDRSTAKRHGLEATPVLGDLSDIVFLAGLGNLELPDGDGLDDPPPQPDDGPGAAADRTNGGPSGPTTRSTSAAADTVVSEQDSGEPSARRAGGVDGSEAAEPREDLTTLAGDGPDVRRPQSLDRSSARLRLRPRP